MNPNKIIFALLFLFSVVLFFAPIHSSAGGGFGLDKIVHAAIFAALVYTALRAFPRQKLITVVLLCLYAYMVEYIQGKFLPLRHFDWMDITSDIVGLGIGLVVFIFDFFRAKKIKP